MATNNIVIDMRFKVEIEVILQTERMREVVNAAISKLNICNFSYSVSSVDVYRISFETDNLKTLNSIMEILENGDAKETDKSSD